MDNKNLEDYNVDQKVDDFIKYTHEQQDQYKTSNLIMTMGSDFQYSNAHMWYKVKSKLQISQGSLIGRTKLVKVQFIHTN